MKYDWFKGDERQFKFYEYEVAGDKVVLIIPCDTKAVGAPWFESDKIYRSSIWRVSDGYPVSLGYKKFVNYGEQPDFEPIDITDKITAIQKVDGSCLICSKYKGEYIFRTRGCFNTVNMVNGDEIEPLVKKYNVRDCLDKLGENFTIIFEWVSPRNRLCVSYDEADIYLTGIVKHEDYSYFKQEELDTFAQEHNLKRPLHYSFDKNKNTDAVSEEIKDWIGVEGIVAYFGEEQQVLKKMKSNWHHHIYIARIMLGNIPKLMGFLFDNGAFEESVDFITRVKESLEHEVIEYYGDRFEKIEKGKKLFYENAVKARNIVSSMESPYDVVNFIKSGEWNNPETYLWSAFRHNEFRKSFVTSEIERLSELKPMRYGEDESDE